MSINKVEELDDRLPILVNAICAKKDKHRYSLYEIIFAAFPEPLLSPEMEKTKISFFSIEGVHQNSDRNSKIMTLLEI